MTTTSRLSFTPSNIFYAWLLPAIWRGGKRPLQVPDIEPLQDSMRADVNSLELADALEVSQLNDSSNSINSDTQSDKLPHTQSQSAHQSAQQHHLQQDVHPRRVTIYSILWRLHFKPMIPALVLYLFTAVTTALLPLLLRSVVRFAQASYRASHGMPPLPKYPHMHEYSEWYGYGLIIAYTVALMSISFFEEYATLRCLAVGQKLRVQFASQTLAKIMRISPQHRSKMSMGSLINLVGSDSSILMRGFGQLPAVGISLVQTLISFVVLHVFLGASALVGCVLLVLYYPLQQWLVKHKYRMQKRLSAITDERVRLIREVLQSIRIIKCFTMETVMLERVAVLRNRELKLLRSIWMMHTGVGTLLPLLMTMAGILAIVTYAATTRKPQSNHSSDTGMHLDPAIVFPALAMFQSLQTPLIQLTQSINSITKAFVAAQRISKLLLDTPDHDPLPEPDVDAPHALELKNASFAWDHQSDAKIEKIEKADISDKDNCRDKPTTSPVPPLPSSFSLQDLSLHVPRGSLVAVVGPVGSGKSALLAALMGDMVPLLDEPGQVYPVVYGGSVGLAAQTPWIMHASVRENITIGEPLCQERYDSVVRACQLLPDFASFPHGDETIIGERGLTLSGGQKQRVSLARLLYYSPDILLLDDPLSAVDATVGRALFDQCIANEAPLAHNKTRILVTHQLSILPRADHVVFMDCGRIAEQGKFSDLMERCGALFDMMTIYNSQVKPSTSIEHSITASSSSSTTVFSINEKSPKHDASEGAKSLMQTEEQEVGGVSLRLFRMYIAAAGGFAVMIIMLFFLVASHASTVGADLWLSAWTMGRFPGLPFYGNVLIYIGLGFAYGLLLFIARLISWKAGQAAAIFIHARALSSVMSAPMAWFDTTPLGRIISRFSDDVDNVDSSLSSDTVGVLENMIYSFGPLIVIAILFPIFFVPCLFVVPMLIFCGVLFVRSGRELRRHRSVAQSAAAAYFTEMLGGISIVTSFKLERNILTRFHSLLDTTSQIDFHIMCLQRWVRLYPAICSNLMALFAGVVVVYSRFDRHPSIAGLIMAYSLRFAKIGQNMVQRIHHLEESMISVERLNHYMYEIETEPGVVDTDDNTAAAGSQWRPSGGAIEFRNVVFRYRPELDPVLHGVSFSITAGEMVGVVGRTGASKSTLVQVLTRLYHIGAQDRHEGSDGSSGVFIDGVDTATVGLRELRASIAVIPQDPVLFHGTVRSNLDPLGRFDDADLHQALGAAGLAGHSDVGLDAPVSEGGANLSAGQSQLLCLARAMLVQARIVVLDEATASVDAAADELIQRVIATKFRGCTVITIAHRLNTIMDYDRVLVMDAGRVVETGPPHALLADPDSHFARMAAAAQAH